MGEQCIDLVQVMQVCKLVWLALEHHNEALVRVAIEVSSCQSSRKCLWWRDGWYANDKQREDFRSIIKNKLNKLMASLKGAPLEEETAQEGALIDAADLQALRDALKEAQAQVAAAQKAQNEAEMRARALDEKVQDMEKIIKEGEKALERLKEQLKESELALEQLKKDLEAEKSKPAPVVAAKVEEKPKIPPEALKKLEDEIKKLKGELEAEKAKHEKEMAQKEAEIKEIRE